MSPPDFRWKIVYHDGTEFSDLDGEPWESPTEGALLLVQPDDVPKIMVNADWYLYRTDLNQWIQCGADGLRDHCVLFGNLISAFRQTLWTHTPDFKALWARAREELG